MKGKINSAFAVGNRWKALSILLIFSVALLGCSSFCRAQQPGLKLSIVASLPSKNIVAEYRGYDKGPGNTSIAYDAEDIYKWSRPSLYKAESWGYFIADHQEIPYIKRDRDLGQTFTYTGIVPKKLTAITVSTAYGTNVVRPKTYNKNISIQVFEVSGDPVMHNNGSDSTMEAFHGFPHNRPNDSIAHLRDDYFTGEIYTSLAIFSGAVFPDKKDFGISGTDTDVPPGHPKLKGRFLKFTFPPDSRIVLQPGKRYAFLVMLDKMGADCGFTLANNYFGNYPGGHGIRRDGDGKFPPVPADPTKNFTDPANAKAFSSAHFPADFKQRTSIAPGTNGYPDVCTWRDLFFIIEAR